jgi:hypothetical protein
MKGPAAGTLQPFLHDQVLVTGNHPNRFEQGLAVGLDREVLELPALLGNDRQPVRGCSYPARGLIDISVLTGGADVDAM